MPLSVAALQLKSIHYRKTILSIIHRAKAGHTGGSLSCTDILNVLYTVAIFLPLLTMMAQYFTGSETWLGGYYELALELGERSEDRLLSALTVVWSHPDFDGIYADRDVEPQEQQKIGIANALQFDMLYGIARLPNNIKIACASFIVREEDGPDWLALLLPMGSLGEVYDVGGFPFDPDLTSSRQWRDELNRWLAQIGIWVFEHVKYRLGIIGMDVSGEVYADEILQSGIHHRSDTGLLWPENDKIVYYPNTE